MFKRSKSKASRGEPTTPKLSPAPLPDTDSWAGPPPPQPKVFGKVLKPFFGRLGFDRRTESPLSTSKACYQSDTEHVSRFRRVPMSKQEDDVILFRGPPPHNPVYPRSARPEELGHNMYPSQRPADRAPSVNRSSTLRSSSKYVDAAAVEHPPLHCRPMYVDPPVEERLPAQRSSIYAEPAIRKRSSRRPNPTHVDPSPMKSMVPTSTTPERAYQPEQRSAQVPLKSALKKGTSNAGAKQEFPPPPLERHTSSRRAPPTPGIEHSVSGQVNRSRKLSLTEQQRSVHPIVFHRPKYVTAITSEGKKKLCSTPISQLILVAMKGEAIALSWPLVDFQSRKAKGMPLVYFDAGFNPRNEELTVRIWRDKWFGPISRQEEIIPVSPHTVLTEMTIECIPPRGFPEHFILWPIHVRRSGGLRCIDIFRAIYDEYNELLTEKEKVRIGSAYLQWCEKAFKKRCEDSPGLPLYNESCGMRRVDVLRGRRIFKSLSQDSTNSRWELRFDDPAPEEN